MLSSCAWQVGSAQAQKNRESVKPISASVAVNIKASISPLAAAGDISQSHFGALALAYIKKNCDGCGITDVSRELVFLNESVDAIQQKHVRFQQVKNDVPVWGGQLIVHFDKHDEPTRIKGSFLSGLEQVETHSIVTTDEAEATAVAVKGEGWHAVGSVLYVYMHESSPKLVYHVTLTHGMERWFVFVDAHDGAVLHQVTVMPSASP